MMTATYADDAGTVEPPEPPRRSPGLLRTGLARLRTFYSHWLGWAALLLTSVLLIYGGGAVMFSFHALYRREKGPAISDWTHWALDSTLGFLALTPMLAVILPSALWVLSQRSERRPPFQLWAYVALVAVTFALVTGPGPFLHGVVAGERSPLARRAMDIFGRDAEVAMRNMHSMQKSPVIEGLLQVGVPVYTALTCLALVLVRRLRRTSTAPVDEATVTADMINA